MSGIAAVWHQDGQPGIEEAVERMAAAPALHGPDGRRVWASGNVGFGHCLRVLTHEDARDSQPLRDSESGLIVVSSSRLDNRRALAEVLGLSSRASDGYFILSAFRRWGEDCVHKLTGAFAFIVWDTHALERLQHELNP